MRGVWKVHDYRREIRRDNPASKYLSVGILGEIGVGAVGRDPLWQLGRPVFLQQSTAHASHQAAGARFQLRVSGASVEPVRLSHLQSIPPA